MKALGRQVAQLTRGVKSRVMMMIARGTLSAISDAGGLQVVQAELLEDEIRDRLERVQNYGLTSHPHAGSACVVAFIGGNRDHGLVIAVDDRRYRLKSLAPGEVALYDDLGHIVHLTREGIEIDGGGHQITLMNTPKVRVEADQFEVTGEIIDRVDAGGRSMSAMRAVYNAHRHVETETITNPPVEEM